MEYLPDFRKRTIKFAITEDGLFCADHWNEYSANDRAAFKSVEFIDYPPVDDYCGKCLDAIAGLTDQELIKILQLFKIATCDADYIFAVSAELERRYQKSQLPKATPPAIRNQAVG